MLCMIFIIEIERTITFYFSLFNIQKNVYFMTDLVEVTCAIRVKIILIGSFVLLR